MNVATGVGIEGGTMPVDNFLLHWPRIAQTLDMHPEAWADYYTKQDIYDGVMSESLQAWAFSKDSIIRVILFTTIINYPTLRVLHVMLAIGNGIEEFIPQIEGTLESFGRAAGCKMCEVVGRPGWERKLGPRFKKRAVVMVSKIEDVKLN